MEGEQACSSKDFRSPHHPCTRLGTRGFACAHAASDGLGAAVAAPRPTAAPTHPHMETIRHAGGAHTHTHTRTHTHRHTHTHPWAPLLPPAYAGRLARRCAACWPPRRGPSRCSPWRRLPARRRTCRRGLAPCAASCAHPAGRAAASRWAGRRACWQTRYSQGGMLGRRACESKGS